MRKMNIFMLFALVTLSMNFSSSLINTIVYSITIVPLATLLGELTTDMSEFIGEKKGGLLAATVGNFPELVMGIWSIKYGMILMAQAALIGSVISNMLLGLGIAVICGGIKYGEQRFNKIIARTNFNMLLLALSAMVVMASIDRYGILKSNMKVSISVKVAVVMISIYILGLIFSLYTHRNLFVLSEEIKKEKLSLDKRFWYIVINLIFVVSLLYFVSEKLIFNVQNIVESYRISEAFLGIILIPLLGNIGEMASAIMSAIKNKVNLSLETSIGSSIQMALFVAPLIVICSYFMGIPMTLFYNTFQIIMTAIAVGMSFIVFQDGKTYWFEGAILMAIYIMITLAYYYIG